MRIIRLPGIHHDVNATLICGDAGNYLIDVGTSWYQLLIQERIRGKIGDDGKLDGVILTCRRYNHSGGAAFLHEEFSAPVYAHPNAAQALATGDFFTTWANRYDSDMPPIETEELVDGQLFAIDDASIEIVETPGHCNDAIAVWQAEKSVLIAGPTIPRAQSPARWDMPTGCAPDILDSIETLLELEAETLIPAHGEAIRSKSAIEDILNRHHTFFAEVIEDDGNMPHLWPRPAPTCNYLTPRPTWPEPPANSKQQNND